MKNFNIALWAIVALLIVSCSDDDDHNHDDDGHHSEDVKGAVAITFDNGYGDNDLILDTKNAANKNGEALTISRLNYIVSNFVLVDVDGKEFAFPKDDSYFIISKEEDLEDVSLESIPEGEYKAIKFGVGVDQEKYLQGADGQGDFLTEAEENNMMWSWAAGYKFLNYEGTYVDENSDATVGSIPFTIHMGSHGSTLDNYKEVELMFPMHLIVKEDATSNIHVKVDVSKILVGETNFKLENQAVIMVDEVKSPQIAENTSKMFEVHHVHNGSSHSHK